MSDNILQDLHTIGINPFGAILLAESVLKSPIAQQHRCNGPWLPAIGASGEGERAVKRTVSQKRRLQRVRASLTEHDRNEFDQFAAFCEAIGRPKEEPAKGCETLGELYDKMYADFDRKEPNHGR